MKNRLVVVIAVIVCAAVFHALWEFLHIRHYVGYEHITTLPIEVYATLGDIGYVIFGIGLLTLVRRTLTWINTPSRGDYSVLAGIGFLIALFVEYKGLWLEKWMYASTMPIIPLLGIGLSPIIQMTVLLPLSVYAASQVSRLFYESHC